MPAPESVKLVFTAVSFLLLAGSPFRPLYGLLGYTIIMMLRPGAVFPVLDSLRVEQLAGILVLLICACTGRVMRSLAIHEETILKWFWLFVAVMFVSMIGAFNLQASWDQVYEFLKVVAFFIMIVGIVDGKSDVKALLWTVCLLTAVISYDAIYNFIQGDVIGMENSYRAVYSVASEGMGAGHVALANLLMQSLPLVWFLGVKGATMRAKAAGGILAALSVYGIFVSGSRGGYAGLVVFLVSLIVLSQRKLAMAAASAVLLVAAPIFMGARYSGYIRTLLDIGMRSGPGSDRISGLRNGIEMFIRRPLLGVGPGCYPVARKAWMGWYFYSHNLYGELIGELGLAGMVVWPMFIYSYLRRCVKYRSSTTDPEMRNIATAVALATVIRLFLGMGTHSLYIFFWYLMAGTVVALARIESSVAAEEEAAAVEEILPASGGGVLPSLPSSNG